MITRLIGKKRRIETRRRFLNDAPPSAGSPTNVARSTQDLTIGGTANHAESRAERADDAVARELLYGNVCRRFSLARRSLHAPNHQQRLPPVMCAGKHFLDPGHFEDALDDGCCAELKDDRLLCCLCRLGGARDEVDDAGVDEAGLADVQDQVVATVEREFDLGVEGWCVREVKVAFEAESDNLGRLGDNPNRSKGILGAGM